MLDPETGAADLSFNLPNESSFVSFANGTATDPLDLVGLADFEDEAALINELLTAESTGLDNTTLEGDASLQDREQGNMSLLELDTKLARLLGTLEHACQETSSQVERAIEEISGSVPRLTFDLQLMRENIILLRFTLDSIRKRSIEATAHSETLQVMRRLKVLDTIKTRMEAARDVLREAEAWSSLESEVTALVQEQAYVKAAERLAEANKSMVVFQNTPEFEARRSLMVSLQNGLEAGLSASLVAAINARDVEVCKNYYSIFVQIQRETEFRDYYFGSRKANLTKNWQNARLQDCLYSGSESEPPSNPPTTFSNYLPTFYNILQSTVNDERTYIPAIFPDPVNTLSLFLQTALDSLAPSFPQRISDLSNSHGPKFLLELIKIYHATEEFAVGVERIFARLATSLATTSQPTPSPSLPSPATPGPTNANAQATPATPGPRGSAVNRVRRQSKAMSISRRHSRGGINMFPGAGPHSLANGVGTSEAAELEPIKAWETSLFEPFLDWQAEYADLETRLLRSELNRITNSQDAIAFLLGGSVSKSQGGATQDEEDGATADNEQARNAAKLLLEQTSTVFSLAEDALGRTMAFTHGYGAAGFVEAIDGTFRTFLLKERDTLIRAKDARARRRKNVDTMSKHSTDGGEERHLDYSQEDWSTFQLALRLLETCRTIWEKIGGLESKVRSRLIDVARLLKEARQDPSNQIVPGTTRGALALLWQSTLNSSALNTLLDIIDQPPTHAIPPFLLQARSASIDLTKASQLLLHETILAPIMQTLEPYAELPVWSQISETRPENKGAFDLRIPTFSLSPSEIITRVGEGFLNLPGMFELYAEDDALAFSLETLPGLDEQTIKHLLKAQGGQSGISPQPSPHLLGHRHRNMSLAGNEFLTSELQSPARISPSTPIHATQQVQSTVPLSAELVISTWLSSLTRSVLVHLTDNILPSIKYLSKHGAEQLASDLGYLSNVAQALDVEVEQVEKWRNALETVDGGHGNEVTIDAFTGDVEQKLEENELVDVVKKMRTRPTLPKRDH